MVCHRFIVWGSHGCISDAIACEYTCFQYTYRYFNYIYPPWWSIQLAQLKAGKAEECEFESREMRLDFPSENYPNHAVGTAMT